MSLIILQVIPSLLGYVIIVPNLTVLPGPSQRTNFDSELILRRSSSSYHSSLNNKLDFKFVLGGGKNVFDDNTIHRGARMVFLILNFDTQLGRSQTVDNDHDKFVERFSRRCN